jgi:hypothetical protein
MSLLGTNCGKWGDGKGLAMQHVSSSRGVS